ncbi:envelope stress response protein PspG [Escherichia sp. SP-MK2]
MRHQFERVFQHINVCTRFMGIIAALVVATAIMFLGGMLALMIKLLPWLLLAIAVVWVIKAIKAPKVPKYQRYDRWRY